MKRPIALTFPLFAFLSALFVLISPRAAHAATTILGGNINTTWTLAGSPYLVQGDVTVPFGGTLTIQAGVDVQFATTDGQGSGLDTSEVEMTIRGTLNVQGTAASPVTFRSLSNGTGQWYGVVLDVPTAVVTTSYLVVQNATYGFRVSDSEPTLSTVTLHTNTYGVYFTGKGAGSIVNSVLRNNNNDGVRLDTTGNSTVTVNVTNTTLYGNNVGVQVTANVGSSATANVKNAIVTNNAFGLYLGAGGGTTAMTATYSNVWGNTTNYTNVTPGTGAQSANPLYVSAPANLRLTSNSPSRFAGDVGGDLGPLPYTGDATSGLLGVLWTNRTLNLAGSPYAATGDLTVAPGVTLTVDPGVTVRFATTDAMAAGLDPSESELQVKGSLKAGGTAAQPVVLESPSSGTGQWWGVHLYASSTGNILSNAVVTEATYGLWIPDGTQAIDGVTLHTNTYGVYFSAKGAGSLTNSVIRNNNNDGVRLDITGNSTVTVNVTNTTLYGNNVGVQVTANVGSSATVNVKNAIVTNNAFGLYRGAGGGTTAMTATYSDIWGNTTNLTNVTAGVGCISSNPLYVSAPANLKLTSTSVCIDAGTAVGAPAKDLEGTTRPLNGDGLNGAEFDMGAYEFAAMSVCGDGTLGAGETCDDGATNGQYGKCKADCSGLGPYCGDGMMNGPEQCDDGNASNNDTCLATCMAAACGDGFVRTGVEQCDDGNMVNTDGCVMGCLTAACGDGYVQTGVETCDDGNMVNGDACPNTCQAPVCGDGIVQMGVEQCDDGNQNNSDACLNSCLSAKCGDGFTQAGVEQCDDGNMVSTDACLNTCVQAKCGDGVVRAGFEQCDDANQSNNDACSNTCITAKCGDGFVQTGVEQCDDGNVLNTDACLNTCVQASCGDGFVLAGTEQCDDGNASNGDACLNQCVPASCGDGFVQTGVEPCDDGNGNNTDACLVGCVAAKCGDGQVQSGAEACDDGNMVDSDGCRNNCSLPGCGDGIVGVGEACDDGNMVNTDACLSTCLKASCGDGFVQRGAEECDDANADDTDDCVAQCKTASCGDGFVKDGTEGCDDGNDVEGDGCNASCETEGQGGSGGAGGGGGGDVQDGGCGCRTAPGESDGQVGSLAFVLGALGLVLARRRKAA